MYTRFMLDKSDIQGQRVIFDTKKFTKQCITSLKGNLSILKFQIFIIRYGFFLALDFAQSVHP